ncbi:hypothetical protein [Sphingobium sp. TCM1]|uniref:hypothetical protein n=1 Tax=Sphingobium sp. TCM1 TaxID=453246 RepID=UPI0012ECD869|nr:hypothetical protein [Sphingobium sp. TCM1]
MKSIGSGGNDGLRLEVGSGARFNGLEARIPVLPATAGISLFLATCVKEKGDPSLCRDVGNGQGLNPPDLVVPAQVEMAARVGLRPAFGSRE